MMSINTVYKYLPERIRTPLLKANFNVQDIQEIRLRVNRPIGIDIYSKEQYLNSNGTLSDNYQDGIVCDKNDIFRSFESICDYSVHSYTNELSQGYVTLNGGNRVGICGTYIFKDNRVSTIKDVNALNFRIANQVRGCAVDILDRIDFSTPKGILIVGRPLSAKTTILRDLCRMVSNKYKLSIIDERSELCGIYAGVPQNDIGIKCDIFNNYPKDVGINMAIRTMSPDIIACDEIGSVKDINAIKLGSICGVKFLCTAHFDSIKSVMESSNYYEILNSNAFDYVVLLGNGNNIGRVLDVKRLS